MEYNSTDNRMNPFGEDRGMRGHGGRGHRPHGFEGFPGAQPPTEHCHRRGMGRPDFEDGPRGFEGLPGAQTPAEHCHRRGMGRPDFEDGPQFSPRGHGGPGGRDFPPRGGHGGPGMPGGLPPRRPDPDFLNRRIDEGDLMELIDMAGRMVHRRPQGGPARGQALILSILAGREALSQRELQQMLGIQPGSLSELLSKLEAKGLLTREKGEDRRGNLLRITEAGREALPQITGEDAASEDDPFAPLTQEQQQTLTDTLRTLLKAWVEAL